MSTTITGKLNRAARNFQAGESTGFGIQLGVKYYDRDTKTNEYTNYEAAIFTRNDKQADFYRQALVEGAIVEITGMQERIKSFEGQNGTRLTIELLDARLGYISQAGNYQQQPGGSNNESQSFGDDISF